MSDVIGNAQILLSANTARFEQDLVRAKKVAGESFSNIKDSFADMSTELKYGAAAVATGFVLMIKSQMDAADEMSKFANVAGVSVQKMQELSAGAKMLGLETDDLNDIYDDLNQKIGEFTATGEGELKDIFDKLPKDVHLTAEAFRKLSGPEALQAVYNNLEKCNLTNAEMIQQMEAVASESSKLIPMLRHNGEGFKLMAEAAENAGAVMDKKTIRASQEMKVASDLMGLSLKGVQNQMTQGLMPVLSDMAGSLVKDATLKNQAKAAGDMLANGFKFIAGTGAGVVGIISIIGNAIGALIAAMMQWAHVADGVDFSSPWAMFQLGKNLVNVPVDQFKILAMAAEDAKTKIREVGKTMDTIDSWGTGKNSGVVKKLTDIKYGDGSPSVKPVGKAKIKSGDDSDDDDDDGNGGKKGKKKKEGFLLAGEQTVLDRAMQHAIQFGYAKLEEQNHIPKGLMTAISMSESAAGIHMRSPAGAIGEFQMLPATARRFGLSNTQDNFKTALQAPAAAKFLGFLYQHFGGNIDKTIAAYNTGEGNVDKKDWNLINSNRWAKGETKNYLAKNRRYLAYINGGDVKNATPGQFIDSQSRSVEQQQQTQEQIEKSFADQSAKRLLDYQEQVKKINASFTDPNDPRRQKYLDQAKEDYNHDVAEYALAQDQKTAKLTDFKKTEKEKVLENMVFTIRGLTLEKDLTADARKKAITAAEEEAKYKIQMLDVVRIKEQQAALASSETTQERLGIEAEIQRREVFLNRQMDEKTKELKTRQIDEAEQAAKDADMQSYRDELEQITGIGKSELQKISDDYDKKRSKLDKRTDISPEQVSELRNALAGAEIQAKRGVKDQIAEPFNDLQTKYNQTNQYPELEKQYKTKYEIIAKYEKLGVEEARKAQVLRTQMERQYGEERYTIAVTQGGQIFGSVASMLKSTLGEHNSFYIATMALEKSANIFRSMLAIKTGISLALANPFPMNLGAMVSVASAGASIISDLMSLRQPSIKGQAHDGIDYIPNEGTWLLDGGERIVKPADNRKLSDFLDNQDGQMGNKNPVNVAIHNHAGVPVQHKQDQNGDIRVIIGKELEKQLPQHVNNPNSDFNQSMKRNYHIQRKL